MRYLAIRCMEDESERSARSSARRKKGRNIPGCHGGGRTFAEQGEYRRAHPMYEHALRNLPACVNGWRLDHGRLRR